MQVLPEHWGIDIRSLRECGQNLFFCVKLAPLLNGLLFMPYRYADHILHTIKIESMQCFSAFFKSLMILWILSNLGWNILP